jgi:hypothetical protein
MIHVLANRSSSCRLVRRRLASRCGELTAHDCCLKTTSGHHNNLAKGHKFFHFSNRFPLGKPEPLVPYRKNCACTLLLFDTRVVT